MRWPCLLGDDEFIQLNNFLVFLQRQLNIGRQLCSLDGDVHEGCLLWCLAYPDHLLLNIVLCVELTELVDRDLRQWISSSEEAHPLYH